MHTTTPVLVIGGGISGAAAAAHLAQARRSVVLIERKKGPHDKVCGEFVSNEAVLYLRTLNIDLAALGAVAITTVRIFANDRGATARLPFPAFSLSRRVLDEALLHAASRRGAEIRRSSGVRSLQPSDRGWVVETEDGHTVLASEAFLATGKHDLRGWKRPPGTQRDLIAFKLHYRLSAQQMTALGSCVELHLFPGGYAGLEPVENGLANLCLVVRRGHFSSLGQTWDALLAALRSTCPHLDRRLAGANPCWNRPLAIASIPYGYVQTAGRGPWLLGDQATVIPSFAGDGISIALHSAQLAAHYYVAGRTGSEFQSRLARDIAGQVRRATLMSRMLVTPLGQAIAATGARILPSLVGTIARHTRIPAHCLPGASSS